MKLSIVIPVYNEKKYIREIVNRVMKVSLSGIEKEIIIIDDCSMDGTRDILQKDLEYDPTEYGKLLQPILDGKADAVYGSRFVGSEPHRVLFFWHYVGNKLLTLLSNMFTNLNLTDMETCYKMFKKEVLDSIQIEQDRFGFEPEITAKLSKGNWRIYEIGISYSGRNYAEGKKINWQDGIQALWCILKYNIFN
jgi:glycosyltransferase involved in cell wall biosynthesis